jgi:hypothetical protein
MMKINRSAYMSRVVNMAGSSEGVHERSWGDYPETSEGLAAKRAAGGKVREVMGGMYGHDSELDPAEAVVDHDLELREDGTVGDIDENSTEQL